MRKMIALGVAMVAALGIAVAAPVPPSAPLTAPAAAALENPVKVYEPIAEVTRVPTPAEAKYRGSNRTIVTFTDQATINSVCGPVPKDRAVIACVAEIGSPIMTLPNPCAEQYAGEDYAAVVCHEKGHTLGWWHHMPSIYASPEAIG